MRKGSIAVGKRIKKVARDFALTVYDDYDFKYISLPRVVFVISVVAVVSAWVAEQFFSRPFDKFGDLVMWCTANAGAYVAKKFADQVRRKPKDEAKREEVTHYHE